MYVSVYMCAVYVYMHTCIQAYTSLSRSKSNPENALLVFSLLYNQGSWSLRSLSNSSEATELVSDGSRILISDLAPGFPALDFASYPS